MFFLCPLLIFVDANASLSAQRTGLTSCQVAVRLTLPKNKQATKLQFVLYRIKAGADLLDDSDLFRSTSLGVFTRSCEEPFVVGHSPFKSEAERREQSMSNSYLQLISTAHAFLRLLFNQKNTHSQRLHGLLATLLQQYLQSEVQTSR